ncbi:copper/zinc binding superoxide dismutase [Cylindrobasidium torrendii FP15055 ss-10]|uniref:Superoxide dismutase [Cu-Zn] n=1 Tax=Cylindrobasidium torrendii FP15055 ss-10 TaxID=1314674 RepID=A0A0D7B086_9AGAR|nr:copper/zinc binding superoxide dismutase [Cylindrobasidium torrendii FP15055 ss-10]
MMMMSKSSIVFAVGLVASAVSASSMKSRTDTEPRTAIVVLDHISPSSNVSGTVWFSQACADSPVQISGHIEGLAPNSPHGAHVHQLGNLTAGCASSGGHFNPFNQTHGAPSDEVRHVGDMGNLVADEGGVIEFELEDVWMSLYESDTSILGRTLVLHGGQDDLGKGGNQTSLENGNSGDRIACGIVGFA